MYARAYLSAVLDAVLADPDPLVDPVEVLASACCQAGTEATRCLPAARSHRRRASRSRHRPAAQPVRRSRRRVCRFC